ncbi:hypothetical protein [Lentzea indica]|uniref:hypothetical protein n=1 Tax=Lentzea indica TaxID=2604800 RepID=UPI001CB7438E|nr:hypothetical protein [Lentzea indica]
MRPVRPVGLSGQPQASRSNGTSAAIWRAGQFGTSSGVTYGSAQPSATLAGRPERRSSGGVMSTGV